MNPTGLHALVVSPDRSAPERTRATEPERKQRVRMIPERLRPKPTPEWSQIVLLAATALRMVSSLGLTILVGRFLSPREFGGFALVATFFGLAHEFTDMGTGNVGYINPPSDLNNDYFK